MVYTGLCTSGRHRDESLRESQLTNFTSRKEGSPEPWDLISSDPEDIKAMHKASRDPKMIMISDWTHVTSDEYMQITKDSNVGTL